MIKFEKFKIKDIVFLAMMSALLMLSGAVAMPVMGLGYEIFGIENLCTAIFFGAILSIGIQKIRKVGSITLMTLFVALIQLPMSPLMTLTTSLSGLVSELIVVLIFHSYEKEKAMWVVSALVAPMGIPFLALSRIIIKGSAFVTFGWLVVVVALLTILVSILGVVIGKKIGKELKKAGKF